MFFFARGLVGLPSEKRDHRFSKVVQHYCNHATLGIGKKSFLLAVLIRWQLAQTRSHLATSSRMSFLENRQPLLSSKLLVDRSL